MMIRNPHQTVFIENNRSKVKPSHGFVKKNFEGHECLKGIQKQKDNSEIYGSKLADLKIKLLL